MSTRKRLPPRLFGDLPGAGAALDVDDPAIATLVWERLLEDGARSDLCRWLADRSDEEAEAWLRTRGDRLSARSWAFWSWLLSGNSAVDLAPRRDNPYWPDAAGDGA